MICPPCETIAMPFDDRIKVAVEPLPTLARLGWMWRDLERRSRAGFFLSWHWIGCWLATIDDTPMLLVARAGDQVVGLGLLMVKRRVRHGMMPVQTLYLNQTGDEDEDVITLEYNDILTERRCETVVWRACFRHLLDQREIAGRRIGELVLRGLHERLVAEVAGLGRPWRELANAGSATVDLATIRRRGVPYLDTLRPTTKRRIRRALALYRARGDVDLSVATTVDQGLVWFDDAGAFHQRRWTARGHPGAFGHPFYVAFHRRLIAAALPAGVIELARVSVADEPIGFLYNFLYRRRVYYYFSGFRFDPDNRLKPGLVSHALCIERHVQAGMDVYDFMGGDNRYKTELGQPGPRIVSIAVQRPNLLLAAERPLRRLKQALTDRRAPAKP